MWRRTHPQDVRGEDGAALDRLLHDVEPDLWMEIPTIEMQLWLFQLAWGAFCQRPSVAEAKAGTTNTAAGWAAAARTMIEARAFIVRNEGWFRPRLEGLRPWEIGEKMPAAGAEAAGAHPPNVSPRPRADYDEFLRMLKLTAEMAREGGKRHAEIDPLVNPPPTPTRHKGRTYRKGPRAFSQIPRARK